MINLLPPERQAMYHYAQRNTQLRRWLVFSLMGLAGLAAISLGGILHIRQTAASYGTQIAASEQSLNSQSKQATDREAKQISGDIRLAVQVLSKEIRFSGLLRQLAAVTPGDVTLANLNISQVKGALDITANTASYDAATQLQVNLADPKNRIFSKAEIVTINCGGRTSADGQAVRYPCTASIRALFAPDNPYLFVNNQKAAP